MDVLGVSLGRPLQRNQGLAITLQAPQGLALEVKQLGAKILGIADLAEHVQGALRQPELQVSFGLALEVFQTDAIAGGHGFVTPKTRTWPLETRTLDGEPSPPITILAAFWESPKACSSESRASGVVPSVKDVPAE